ncbi:hypothetical protein M758_9G017600 [Ceratodon purpureus]|nr:hypothetical protein M758_9G017600 [Ceratodon purpureus]
MCTKCGEKRGRVRQEFARFVEKVLKDHAGDLPAGEFTLEEDHVKQKVRTIIKGNYDNFKQEMERVGMHLIDQEAIFDYVRSRQKHLRKKAKKGAAPGGNIVQQEVNAEPQKVKAKPQEVKQTKRRKTQEVYEEPQEVNKGPQQVDEEPQEVNAEPQKVKEKPQKVKAEPLKVDAEPQEVKAEPREVKQTKRRKTK